MTKLTNLTFATQCNITVYQGRYIVSHIINTVSVGHYCTIFCIYRYTYAYLQLIYIFKILKLYQLINKKCSILKLNVVIIFSVNIAMLSTLQRHLLIRYLYHERTKYKRIMTLCTKLTNRLPPFLLYNDKTVIITTQCITIVCIIRLLINIHYSITHNNCLYSLRSNTRSIDNIHFPDNKPTDCLRYLMILNVLSLLVIAVIKSLHALLSITRPLLTSRSGSHCTQVNKNGCRQ